ncbi:MAG TPA: glycosyltransferase [Actinocatenispora sp.]
MSASIGGGHDAAANEIVRRLRATGHRAERFDLLDMFPLRFGAVLRKLYATQLAVAPATWGPLCALLGTRPMVWLQGLIGLLFTGRAMRRRVGGSAAVVSTYPIATLVLGRMRRSGLDVPLLAYLPDVAVHPLWRSAGCDTYLAPYRTTAEQAVAMGARDVRLVGAAVRPEFSGGRGDMAAARRRFGLPATGRLALVVAGAWAVGDVERTAADIAASGAATPVVVCATNDALHAAVTDAGSGIALGWVDDMATLMRACDVVVTNGGGITSAEAAQLGVPVLVYRPLPGHARDNAAVFDAAGIATWVRRADDLAAALRAPAPAVATPAGAPDPAAVVAAAAGVPVRVPVARRRVRRLVAAGALAVAGAWVATGGTSAAVAHGFQSMRPAARGIYLVVDLPTDRPTDPDALANLAGMHAGLAVTHDLVVRQPETVRTAARDGIRLLNAGSGRPYETGLVARRYAIGDTARLVRELTGRPPAALVSDGSLDSIDVASAAWVHERILVPNRVVPAGAPVTVRPGQVLLVDFPAGRPADTGLVAVGRDIHTPVLEIA